MARRFLYNLLITRTRKPESVMEVQVVTVAVSSLQTAREFYSDLLGFEVGEYYAPTRWQPFKHAGRTVFAVIEQANLVRPRALDQVDFCLADVRSLWESVKTVAEVEEPLRMTPWGSYKFVIRDPDGLRVGFVQKR